MRENTLEQIKGALGNMASHVRPKNAHKKKIRLGDLTKRSLAFSLCAAMVLSMGASPVFIRAWGRGGTSDRFKALYVHQTARI